MAAVERIRAALFQDAAQALVLPASPHLPLVVVASPHQNSRWSNLCMGKRSERGLWRCSGAGERRGRAERVQLPAGVANVHTGGSGSGSSAAAAP